MIFILLKIKIISFSDKNLQRLNYFSTFKIYTKMKTIVDYTDRVKDMKWEDFNFETISINTLPKLDKPTHYKNSFIFRDALLQAIKDHFNQAVFKLLFITPDQSLTRKFYGIAFLDNKTIATVNFKVTPTFKTWFDAIDKKDKNQQTDTSNIYSFADNLFSKQPSSNYDKELIIKNTGEFIMHQIPNQFIAEQLTKEKTDFITPYIELDVTYNLDDIKTSFETLVAKKNLIVTPAKNNDTAYAKFKNEAGFDFPKILKSFLTLHNGIKNTAFMSAEQIVLEWVNWKMIYDDWTQGDLLDNYSTNEGKALLMYTTPYWIPFFDLQNGNFLAMDFAPNTKGAPGQIIRFGADQEIGYIEDKNLNSFLLNLANDQSDIEDFEWLQTN